MEFLEKELEQIIYETENELLRRRGLCVYGKKYRQLRIGNYGVSDIVSVAKEGSGEKSQFIITVYELKQKKIDLNTLAQAFRYCKGISRYIESRGKVFNISYKAVLIGKDISQGDFVYLPDFYENDIFLYTYNMNINGLLFNHQHGYSLINEGFK